MKKSIVRILFIVVLLAACGSTPVFGDGGSPPSCRPPLVCRVVEWTARLGVSWRFTHVAALHTLAGCTSPAEFAGHSDAAPQHV